MSDKNVQLVQKTKEILKEMGFDIKTTQIYEMYSKVLNEKNWNVAKSKKIIFHKELFESYDLVDLVTNIEKFDDQKVITRLFKEQKMQVEEVNPTLDNFGVTHLVQWDEKSRVAIICRCQKLIRRVEQKHITRLYKAMSLNNCTHGIIFSSTTNIPNSFYTTAAELGIEIVDHEDMINLAKKISMQK